MSEYTPPLDDIRFVLDEILDLAALAKLPDFEHADPDLVHGALAEAGRFAAEVIAPRRTTFYGSDEIWVREPGGNVVGFSKPSANAG